MPPTQVAMSHILKTNNKFDLQVAVLLAEASAAAYGNSTAVKTWGAANGFSGEVHFFAQSDVEGFWSVEGDVGLLALRGTQSAAHWIRNLSVIPYRHEWGFVHVGFLDGITDIEAVMQSFSQAARHCRHVWVTGHSLGGAMAIVAAARLKLSGIRSSVYTFGQPRMCSSGFGDRFATELPGRFVRFVNQNDIVPRIPPAYTHFGNLKRIVRPGVLELLQTPNPQIETLVDPVMGAHVTAARAGVESAALESAAAIADSGIIEPLAIDSELPPLTEQEFRELQIVLQAEEVLPNPELEGIETEGMELEGIGRALGLPSFSDHGIKNYISLLAQIRDAH